ncbi:hypothetical protein Syun_029316 [Stephania yunnanensis]|uniref:Uncharacterized protein n=1 Tax=Stephania yunnanensis TaxID=152371 RepID=A0AAP0HJC2_9MAGN
MRLASARAASARRRDGGDGESGDWLAAMAEGGRGRADGLVRETVRETDPVRRLQQSQQGAGKEYVCVAPLHSPVPDAAKVSRALEALTDASSRVSAPAVDLRRLAPAEDQNRL